MTWGLALSGGGAWGIANAGVLAVLEEENLKPDYVSGSSMGAIVGALHCLGYPSSVLKELIENISLWNVAKVAETPLKKGLHGGFLEQNMTELLTPLIGDATIGDCKTPFVCVAGKVDSSIDWHTMIFDELFTKDLIDSVELHIFPDDTPLLDAITASSAIPVLFAPKKIGDDTYIDLCTFGAVPTRSLQNIHNPDIIIATMTTPTHKTKGTLLPKGLHNFLKAGQDSLDESLAAADLVLEPDLPGTPASFHRGDEFFVAGVEIAKKKMDEIRSLAISPV